MTSRIREEEKGRGGRGRVSSSLFSLQVLQCLFVFSFCFQFYLFSIGPSLFRGSCVSRMTSVWHLFQAGCSRNFFLFDVFGGIILCHLLLSLPLFFISVLILSLFIIAIIYLDFAFSHS